MHAFRSVTIGTSVVALAAAGLVALASPATAQPCGNAGNGSSGFGSIGLGSSGGQAPKGPQGALPVVASGNTNAVEWVTGPRSKNNTYDRFAISGTDLGISWDNGSGQILMAFGDTFGNCSVPGQQWRHNVLLRSDDKDPSDGITISNAAPGEMIPALGVSYVEMTTIPTAAISIGNTQYVNYMSVRAWGAPGRWDTNFSAIAVSRDNGQTWAPDTNTMRVNLDVTIPGIRQTHQDNSKFQMNAYTRGNDGYIYQYGTPNGRFGPAFLARFLPQNILDLTKYEYFTTNPAQRWSKEFGNLASVAPQPISELSVAWNNHLQRYVMLHTSDPAGGLVMRTAERPEGPWSAPKLLAPAKGLGGIYAPYIHPSSSGKYLYYTASVWKDYNVMLLRTDLDRV